MQMPKPETALFFLLTAAALLTAGCRGKQDDGPSPSAPLPVWEPDAKLLEELGPPTTVEDYQVRPPKAYSLTPPAANAAGTRRAFYWTGMAREDKTKPHFLIGLISSPAEDTKEKNLERELNELLEGFKRRMSNWTQTSPERGQVDGLTFVRTHWNATDRERQGKVYGFMYVASDQSTMIHISSMDAEPSHLQALKVAEAAALTFKRK